MSECYRIHTLPVLRNEIKMYNALKRERNKIIEDYEKPLEELKLKLLEVEEKLMLIKSPGGGNGLGGFVQDSAEKFNFLIDQKNDILFDIRCYVQDNEKAYKKELEAITARIATVDAYLELLNEDDREFIEDLYVNCIKFRCVMEKYLINNESNVYRKASNILSKII
uniref:hypothetical protein n=1 Tax=Thomasclavelia spiroformis TaxID=29348 RepID=UPI00359C2ABE